MSDTEQTKIMVGKTNTTEVTLSCDDMHHIIFLGRLCRHSKSTLICNSLTQSISHSLSDQSCICFNYDVPAATFIVAFNMLDSRPFTQILCWFIINCNGISK